MSTSKQGCPFAKKKVLKAAKLNKEVAVLSESRMEMVKEIEVLKKSEHESKGARKQLTVLEEEIAQLKKELDKERSEKIDLVTERAKEQAHWKKKENELEQQVMSLTEELESNQQQSQKTGQVNTEEFQRRSEYEQERIAYQKLLKDYNQLETQFENLQDELYQAKGIERAESSLSFASSSFVGEGESAYGSQLISGKSSLRSGSGRDRPGLNQVEWEAGKEGKDGEDNNNSVGLTVKLQQKLNEAQRDKEKLKKRVEELENEGASPTGGEKQTADLLRLQELEVENGKQETALKKIREAMGALAD